ncbi:sugar phosphate isomerase/epimerase family protein [Candidatus Magnetominusculus xianensis]|uniref:Xylose isomerase n=1 Tax=Candidatus Magnetominusculus xianensis TaxID=1748249 RepID=A0ABR5SIL4_9BACT|nr:sugar phosphate isomerase/epimerase family protein [Candidatus Magnetominusculus xianensis]KWT91052.1 xylose isomerase [Candidatus Magnetominusculus xianensis]MBF0403302.1 sugar phosphate isomerase/epimerase [Nitrospirota bacterium]
MKYPDKNNNKMKLAVSNVAWYPKQLESLVTLMRLLDCDGIELATSMIWDEPVDSSRDDRLLVRRQIEDNGLKVTGLQALLYTRRELTIFGGGRSSAIDYLTKMMDLCRDLGGEVMVFGSPANRKIEGLNSDEAMAVAVDFFHELGTLAGDRGVYFCIEPLGKTETNFINTVLDADELIKKAGNPAGLGLHVDIKALIDEAEINAPYITDAFSRAKHVHVNDPELMPPGSMGFDSAHKIVNEKIKASGYSRYISIEMRRQEPDPEAAIRQAVKYVRAAYFGGL